MLESGGGMVEGGFGCRVSSFRVLGEKDEEEEDDFSLFFIF